MLKKIKQRIAQAFLEKQIAEISKPVFGGKRASDGRQHNKAEFYKVASLLLAIEKVIGVEATANLVIDSIQTKTTYKDGRPIIEILVSLQNLDVIGQLDKFNEIVRILEQMFRTTVCLQLEKTVRQFYF